MDTQPDINEGRKGGVGGLLRASRLRRGEELADVSAALRIRYPYLEAIEEDRYEDLPGHTYAVGFIRGYAEYLGLDGEEVVRRFKDNTGTVEPAPQELAFPSFIPEHGIPRGAILMAALLIAIAGYGGWYFVSTQDRFATEVVPPVPENIEAESTAPDGTPMSSEASIPPMSAPTAAMANAPTPEMAPKKEETSEPPAAVSEAEPEPKPEPEAVAAKQPEPEVTPPAPAVPETSTVTMVPVEGPRAATPEPAQPKIPSKAPAAMPAEPMKTEVAEPVSNGSSAAEVPVVKAPLAAAAVKPAPDQVVRNEEPPAPPAPPAAENESAVSAPETAPEPSNDAASEPDVPAAPEVTADDAVGNQMAAATPAAHIVVRALRDSWVQIRDGNSDQLVMTKLLRGGDIYRVPDRKGLILMTGNAGALEITVDGKAVPPIGDVGVVRRNVALDPEKLRQGKAVVE